MARHNIVLGRDAAFTGSRGYAGFDAPVPGQAANGASPADLEAAYARPSATSRETGRMSMRDALNAITLTLGTIVIIGAAVMVAPIAIAAATGQDVAGLSKTIGIAALLPGAIGGFVLGLVNSFKRTPSAALTLLYAVFEGLLLGGLSSLMESQLDGIVLQAVGGTFAVAATVFVLFRLGVLRTTPTLNKVAAVASVAYLVFLLGNIVLGLVTGQFLYTGLLGLVIGALAVLLASYFLVGDLEDVQRGVRNGVPRVTAWRCAFGLAATLVWMYVEILRVLSILRSN